MTVGTFLARYRVALGFATAMIAFWLARPTPRSVAIGAIVALAGESIRVWAAGHIDKGREITTSGPYRFVRHPLYLGSALMGVGFVIAAQSPLVAVMVLAYLGLTLSAAIRREEAVLDDRFKGAYSSYRAGDVGAGGRQFSVNRVLANREYRALAGLVAGLAVLWWRAQA